MTSGHLGNYTSLTDVTTDPPLSASNPLQHRRQVIPQDIRDIAALLDQQGGPFAGAEAAADGLEPGVVTARKASGSFSDASRPSAITTASGLHAAIRIGSGPCHPSLAIPASAARRQHSSDHFANGSGAEDTDRG
jgi:hypothetical protein